MRINVARIRPARIQDLSRMIEIEIAAAALFPREVLPDDFKLRSAEDQILEAIQTSLAWVADAEIAGSVGFLAAKAFGNSLHIVEMDVHPAHARQGIGSQLIAHAAARAKVLGYQEVTLTTFRHIPWNAPFYAQHGFLIIAANNRLPHLDEILKNETEHGLRFRVAMSRHVA